MSLSCKIIEDLLPLYHDGVCSEESRQLVDEHLSRCESCRAVLNGMMVELEVPRETADDKKALERIRSKWKKSNRKALLKGVVIALAVIILGFSAAGIVWYRTCAVFYQALAEKMNTQAEYPHEYAAPTTPGQVEEEPPVWFFPREYFAGTHEYEYRLRLPGFLDFSGGVIAVYPTNSESSVTEAYISLGIQFMDGKPEYIISIYDKAKEITVNLLVDGELNLLHTDRFPSEELLARDQGYLETYCEEIQQIVTAAKEMWGLE